MSLVDPVAVQQIIEDVAATEIMPRFRHLKQGDIEMKAANDPVTVADKLAEIALSQRLQDLLPGSVVIGEESYAADSCILSRFQGDEYVWIIDPVDGTSNFVDGKPEFGTIIALVRNKQTIAGWIHDPNTKDTMIAEKGSGVRLRGYEMRLSGKNPDFLSQGILGWKLHRSLQRLKKKKKDITLPDAYISSAAAFDYGRLFTGEVLFANSDAPRASFLLGADSKPWDHAAGLLMVEEAGGYACSLLGTPYEMDCIQYQGLLSAAGRTEWCEIRRVFDPVIQGALGRRTS